MRVNDVIQENEWRRLIEKIRQLADCKIMVIKWNIPLN